MVALLSKSLDSLIRTGELYKLRREAGIVEPWVYFSCTLSDWEAFDPQTGRWITNIPRMPFDRCFELADKESLAVGTNIFVFGREVSRPAVFKYSLLTNEWTTTDHNKQMITPRSMFASSAVGTTAYVAGGCSQLVGDQVLDSAEMYDAEKDEWTAIAPLHAPRRACSGVIMDGKFYVVGGTDDQGVGIRSAEVYDPVSKTWEVIPDMFPRVVDGMESPPLVAVVKDEMYTAVVGSMEVLKYVKEKNVWVSVGMMPEKVRKSSHGWGVAFRGCGDRLLVVGGPPTESELEVNSWVPPGDGEEQHGPIQWDVIGKKKMRTFVYNCAIMAC
ncbi:F-box/kelch-repeat protein At1g26930 [Linum grandiflorum]